MLHALAASLKRFFFVRAQALWQVLQRLASELVCWYHKNGAAVSGAHALHLTQLVSLINSEVNDWVGL